MYNKIVFLLCFLILDISCNTPNPKNQINVLNELNGPKKVKLDSLIAYRKKATDENIKLGNLFNLDVIYGFRNLKFMTDLDSIDFGYVTNFDNIYQSKGIVIAKIEHTNINTFRTGDRLELTFYKNKLVRIFISNSNSSGKGSFDRQEPLITQLIDLEELFGNPTRINNPYYPYTGIMCLVKISDSISGGSRSEVEWRANKVILRFQRYWITEKNTSSIGPDYVRMEDSNLLFTLIDYKNKIEESMKFIDDSLTEKQENEIRKSHEQDLKNRF